MVLIYIFNYLNEWDDTQEDQLDNDKNLNLYILFIFGS